MDSSKLDARASKMILESSSRIVEVLEDQIYDANTKLKNVDIEKRELGVNLYTLKRQMDQLREKQAKTNDELVALRSENALLRMSVQTANDTKSKLEKECTGAKNRIENMGKELQEHQEHVESIQQVSRSLKQGLKAQKFSESIHKEREKIVVTQLKEQKEKNDRLEAQLRAVSARLEDKGKQLSLQEHETKIAQRQLDKIADEMKLLYSSKRVLQDQWQTSLQAMSKRDLALEALKKRHEEMEALRYKEVISTGSTVSRVKALEAALTEQTQLREMAEEKISKLQNQLNVSVMNQKSLGSEMETHAMTGRRTENRLEEIRKKREKVENAHVAVQEERDQLKSQLKDSQEEVHRLQATLEKTQQDLTAQGIREKQALVKDQQQLASRESMTENKFQRQMLLNQVQARKIEALEKQLSATEKSDLAISDLNQKLLAKEKKLEMTTLRLRHQNNKLLDDLELMKKNRGTGLNIAPGGNAIRKDLTGSSKDDELENARKIIEQQHKEIGTLRLQWSRLESNLIVANQKIAELRPAEKKRVSDVQLLTHLQLKSAEKIAKLEKKTIETAVLVDTSRVQQRKANDAKFKLMERNAILTANLENTNTQLLDNSQKLENEIHMLQSNLVHSKRANTEVLRGQFESESKWVLLKGRYDLLMKRYEGAKKRIASLEEESSGAKYKCSVAQRERSKLQQRVEQLVTTIQRLENKWKMDTGKKSTSGKESKRLEHDLLRTKTTLAGKEQDVVELEKDLKEERRRAERLGQAFLKRDQAARELAEQLEWNTKDLQLHQERLARTLRVASNLESQLLANSCTENGYISYFGEETAAPSNELLAAINSDESTQAPNNNDESKQVPNKQATPPSSTQQPVRQFEHPARQIAN